MPVLLATDSNTDMGRIAEQEGFGLWCKSGDLSQFMSNMTMFSPNNDNIVDMGEKGKKYMLSNYTVDKVADITLQVR